MPDPRFYETLAPATIGELAALTGSEIALGGDPDTWVTAVASLSRARTEDLSFCGDRRHIGDLRRTAASACFVTPGLGDAVPPNCIALITPLPQAAFAAAADRLHRPVRGRNDFLISPDATLEAGVSIGAGSVVGPNVQIGRDSIIGPGACIGPGVRIGRACQIGPRVVIGFALIGDHVKIHGGAVIGEPGFGAAPGARGVVDMPQFGRVILQDGVTIGANTCVDRGAFEDTVIGENTKIDNLVQIAHNVVIGRNCLLAAQTGISGSTTLGEGCMLGGRVGISDHVTVGAGVRLAAAAGVMKDVPPGETWGGTPARPVTRWMRETAMLSRLAIRRSGGAER